MRARSKLKPILIRRDEKWPREYASEIIKLKTKDEMISAMKDVPGKFKSMTGKPVNSMLRKRSGK